MGFDLPLFTSCRIILISFALERLLVARQGKRKLGLPGVLSFVHLIH
jgi:hypothetical protein